MTNNTNVIYLNVDLVEKICHPLAVAYFNNVVDDPIAPFYPHKLDRLEASLYTPKQVFGGEEQYKTIHEKAAALFYFMCENHPFDNGNKRIATASLLVFLYLNDYWLEASRRELADWGIRIASSGAKIPPETIRQLLPELVNWLIAHVVQNDGGEFKIDRLA